MAAIKPNFYKQTDYRWANVYGNGATIGRNGCGPTAMANVTSALVDSKITPVQTFKWLVSKKYISGNTGTWWAGITEGLKHFGIKKFTVTSSAKSAHDSLKAGKWVIGTVTRSRWTQGGHYILLYSINGNDRLMISDSASSSDYRQKNAPWSEYRAAERQQWICIDPKDYKKANLIPKKSTIYILYVSSARATVRAKRGKKYKGVGTLTRGKKLTLYSYKDGWYKIKEGKYKGHFISEKDLSKYKPYVSKFKLLTNMNVRNGYTTVGTKVLCVLKKGSIVKSSKVKGNWIYVPAVKGWLCVRDKFKTYLKEIK